MEAEDSFELEDILLRYLHHFFLGGGGSLIEVPSRGYSPNEVNPTNYEQDGGLTLLLAQNVGSNSSHFAEACHESGDSDRVLEHDRWERYRRKAAVMDDEGTGTLNLLEFQFLKGNSEGVKAPNWIWGLVEEGCINTGVTSWGIRWRHLGVGHVHFHLEAEILLFGIREDTDGGWLPAPITRGDGVDIGGSSSVSILTPFRTISA